MIIDHEYGKREEWLLDIVKCETCTHIKNAKAQASSKEVRNSAESIMPYDSCGPVVTEMLEKIILSNDNRHSTPIFKRALIKELEQSYPAYV